MENYSSKQDWVNAKSGEIKLLGFQQVISNEDKVHVWIREEVDYPNSQNRHKTTRIMNDSNRKHNWGKSVWLKSKLWNALSGQLEDIGISYQDLINLNNDALSDKWETKKDGYRNFLKAEIINPYCEETRQPLRIQITQSTDIPDSIYSRAAMESRGNDELYVQLFNKYEESARIQTYTSFDIKCANGITVREKALKPVFAIVDNNKVYVYEESEIVIGEPNHIFVDYQVANQSSRKNVVDIEERPQWDYSKEDKVDIEIN